MFLRKKRSAILGVASILGHYPMPGDTIYCATKVFISHLFQALSKEIRFDLRSKNKIDILTYSPGIVDTKINIYSKGIGVPGPMEAVEAVLKDIGRIDHSYAIFAHDI